MEELEFQLVEMQCIDSSRELKCLVVIVKIVLVLGCQEHCSKDHFMCI